MRTFAGLSCLPGTTSSTWLFSREQVDARNFFTSSLIGSEVFSPAHEGPSDDGGWGAAVLLLSVVDLVPVVVVDLDVVELTDGEVVLVA